MFDIPSEPSAFSSHNIMSGPFYDPASEPVRVRRGPRDLQNEEDRPTLQDDWGMDAPLHVGKQGKNKDKEKLAKRLRDQEADDTGDWFNNPRNVRNRGNDRPTLNGPKVMKFGTSMKDAGRHFDPPPSASPRKNGPLSLLDRLGDNPHRDRRRRTSDQYGPPKEHQSYAIRGASKNTRDRDDKYSRSSSGRERDRQRRDSREWDRDRGHGQGNRPRYQGGYSR
jgi:protein AIR1/2